MNKEEFDRLSEKYLAGKCTADEVRLIERWASMHYVRHSNHPIFTEKQEALETESKIWGKIKRELEPEIKKPSPTYRIVWGGVAAALAVVLLGSWYYLNRSYPGKLHASVPPGIESKNTTVSSQRITLPDSSTVVLEAGASIVASESYGQKKRIVYLTGEAFFDVRPNPQQPFLVYSGELVTEVLGTSFRIKPEQHLKTIEVSVMTGKVSIYTEGQGNNKKRNGVIITPNQKVVFDTESKMMRQDLVDLPQIVVPLPAKSAFIFDDVPVEEILALMEKTYAIEIVVDNIALKRCVFTGDISGIGLYEQLDYLCEALSVTYEIRGTGIFISGSGCG